VLVGEDKVHYTVARKFYDLEELFDMDLHHARTLRDFIEEDAWDWAQEEWGYDEAVELELEIDGQHVIAKFIKSSKDERGEPLMKRQVIRQVRDTLDTLLPLQGITIRLTETQAQLSPAEREELVRLVDKAVLNLLAIDCLLTNQFS